MKKVIVLVIILAFVGNGSIFAVDWFYTVSGLLCTGLGGGFLYWMASSDMAIFDYPAGYGAAGGLALGGLILTIYGLSADKKGNAQPKAVDQLNHIILNARPDSVTVGYRISF
jgi:hypothetical protein